jgi:hypothetical protein
MTVEVVIKNKNPKGGDSLMVKQKGQPDLIVEPGTEKPFGINEKSEPLVITDVGYDAGHSPRPAKEKAAKKKK